MSKGSEEEILHCSWGIISWKNRMFLQNFKKAPLEKLVYSRGIFFLLENRMCSCEILRKLSWKSWCVLLRFASPGKCVLVMFLILLETLICFNERITSSPGKFDVF